jgi:predicted transcriptional regulator
MSEHSRYVCGHRLPALEAEVLELLLDAPAPMTVAEVQEALPGNRRAHTTVSTLLTRLGERRLVDRSRRGRLYEWFPADTAQGLAIRALAEVLAGVEEPHGVVMGFLESITGAKRKRRGKGGH